MTPETRFFDGADGVRLAADIAGPAGAPPVILLHGGGQTRHSWADLFGRLGGAGYRAINLDLRGHGGSDWSPNGDYGIDTLARDVLAVAATCAVPPAVIGASLGGVSGFCAAGLSRSRAVSALVMVDIALRSARKGSDRIGAFMARHTDGFASLEEAADAVAAFNPLRRRATDPAGLRKNLRLGADGRFYWHWDPHILAWVKPGILEHRYQRLVEVSARVSVPTLLVRGEHSDVVTPDSVREMQALVSHLETVEVAGAGHMVASDRNDAFGDQVLAFLHRHLVP